MSGGGLIYVFLGFFGGLYLIFDGTRKHLLVQKITNTPTSKVRSAAVGLVELHGAARCKGEMVSPVAKTKCGFWRIIAQFYKSGKHGGWRTFYKIDSTSPFYLEDNTGKILVDPKGAKVEIPQDHKYQGYISGKGLFGMKHKKIDEKVLKYIEEQEEKIRRKFDNYKNLNVRVFEYYVADGDEVYVLGDAEIKDDEKSDVGYKNLVVKKGKYEKVMYISDRAERKIVYSLESSVRNYIVGGLILSSICLMLLLLFSGIMKP